MSATLAPSSTDTSSLQQQLHRAERRNRLKSLALIAPLVLFLLVIFLLPMGLMLKKSIENPDVAALLPDTIAALSHWDGKALPDDAAYHALAEEITRASEADKLGNLGKRLNNEIAGYRSLLNNSADGLPFDPAPESWKAAMVELDPRWGELPYWQAINRNRSAYTSDYLLSSLDLQHNQAGEIVPVAPEQAIYQDVFLRTFWMSLVITACCLLLAYPLAYLLATLPVRTANLLMILVLLPFWTSLLVRTTSWIALLQEQGIVNDLLVWLGLIGDDNRLAMMYNMTGTIVAMTHVLLPFMILPLYSVMRVIPPSYARAARSLGATSWTTFRRVYVPQTLPGIAAGSLLVFILAVGYYITPALVGGADGQLISNLISFHMSKSNWSLAAALAAMLLAAILLLYWLYDRLVGIDRLKLG